MTSEGSWPLQKHSEGDTRCNSGILEQMPHKERRTSIEGNIRGAGHCLRHLRPIAIAL